MKLVTGITVVTLLGLSGVQAAPIYSWQDEQGNTHFSDRPLAEDAEKLSPEYSTQSPAIGSAEQPETPEHQYSIRNQIEYFDQKREAERQAWLEERQFRKEERAQQLEKQYLEQQAEQSEQRDTVFVNPYPYYRPYRSHRPHRPHRPNRPDRPGDPDRPDRPDRPAHHPKHSFHPYPSRGVQVHSPYAKQLLIQDPNQRRTPVNRFPNAPLNFWKH